MNADTPYRPGREIARGGMGAILDAHDSKLGRSVAMKILLRQQAGEEEKMRFLQEARVLGQLAHPNVVPVHDLGTDEHGRLFYTMKLVQGVTLHDILQLVKAGDAATLAKHPLNHLLTIFQKVCDGVAFAHSRGIIHRDLKPQNIMVGEFGEVLVMDWGLAKFLPGTEAVKLETVALAPPSPPKPPTGPTGTLVIESDPANQPTILSTPAGPVGTPRAKLPTPLHGITDNAPASPSTSQLTVDGTVMGTPSYMSPEQAAGRVAEVDTRADVYSLGAILYTILTLRPPVDGESATEVLGLVRTGSIVAPATIPVAESTLVMTSGNVAAPRKTFIPLRHCPDGQVPGALSAVTMKALSYERERRYQSVAELAQDIVAYQNGFATSAEEASALTLVRLFIARHRSLALATMVVIALSAAFTAKVVSEGRRAEAALRDLRRTAPIMAREAMRLAEQEKFDEALNTLDSALALDATNAEYHFKKACLLQAVQRLGEAANVFRQVLVPPADAGDELNLRPKAELNLRLCEKLLRAHPAGQPLDTESRNELLQSLIEQGRMIEAVPLSKLLGKEMETAEVAIKTRLGSLTALPGFKWEDRLKRQGNGTFRLDINDLPIITAPPLGDLPITHLNGQGSKLADLRPLRGSRVKWLQLNVSSVQSLEGLQELPLEELHLWQSRVTDLTPLRGLPLKYLSASGIKITDLTPLTACRSIGQLEIHDTQITDLAPLRGLQITNLHLNLTRVTDLAPLQGMPLVELDLSDTPVADLAVLRAMPLRRLNLHGCVALTDFGPLADCVQLEILHLPKLNTDWSFLRKLPKLQRLSDENILGFDRLPYAQAFWRLHDARFGIKPKPATGAR